MPNLTFVMPHWLYWSGLILFPLAAIYIVRRRRLSGTDGAVNLPTAYLFLVTAGFVGVHRYYLKSLWGIAYIPLFVAILVSNVYTRDARELVSNANNQVKIADFDLERFQKDLDDGLDEAAPKVEKARAAIGQAKSGVEAAHAEFGKWNTTAGVLAAIIALLLLGDAILLPGLTRKVGAAEASQAPALSGETHVTAEAPHDRSLRGHPIDLIHTPVTRFIDKISGISGEFVCYWSLLAVFVYYYEVLARYVFNSPTNWAHEAMFLMFGMQYLLSGALALREDSHVRVDVIYLMFSDRAKAFIDVVSSIFFFLFTLALFWTGWTFAADSIAVWEVSFTEWAIQYWPVKMSIALGAFFLTLQGLTKLMKDILYLTAKEV